MANFTEDFNGLVGAHQAKMKDDSWAVELNHTIISAAQNFVNQYNGQCEDQQITHPGLPVLYDLLHHGGKVTQKQLSQRLPVSKQNLTITLKALEKKGLVEKKTLQRDHRRNQIKLTEKGIAILRQNIPVRNDFYTRFMDHIGEEKGRELILLLRKINKFYEKELKKQKLRKKRNSNKEKT